MIPNGSIVSKSLYISNSLKPYSYQSWYYKSYEHYLNMTEEEKAVFFKYKESQYAKRNKWVKSICRKFRNETLIRKSRKCVPDGKILILFVFCYNTPNVNTKQSFAKIKQSKLSMFEIKHSNNPSLKSKFKQSKVEIKQSKFEIKH